MPSRSREVQKPRFHSDWTGRSHDPNNRPPLGPAHHIPDRTTPAFACGAHSPSTIRRITSSPTPAEAPRHFRCSRPARAWVGSQGERLGAGDPRYRRHRPRTDPPRSLPCVENRRRQPHCRRGPGVRRRPRPCGRPETRSRPGPSIARLRLPVTPRRTGTRKGDRRTAHHRGDATDKTPGPTPRGRARRTARRRRCCHGLPPGRCGRADRGGTARLPATRTPLSWRHRDRARRRHAVDELAALGRPSSPSTSAATHRLRT